ncbi:hypothetical protein YC2023_108294 [Brassica napus]
MQPACAQVSAKSILTGALKPKRVNSSHQYAWPRSYQGKMLTLGWMMESRASISTTWTNQTDLDSPVHQNSSLWVGTLLSLLPPSTRTVWVRSVGLFVPTLSRAGLRSMAGLSPVNFPGTFPANFPVDRFAPNFKFSRLHGLGLIDVSGAMNIRRMSGDWIASVCRLCARAPNYRPTILLSFFTSIDPLEGKSGASSRGNSSSNSLVVEPWDGSPGPPSVSTGRLVSSVGDTLLALTGRVVPPALRTTAKAFAKDVFINQERKLGARRRSYTVLVSTINDADQGSADVAFRNPLAPYEKSKFLGSGGSMVARLKLKGIDGRAPPGVEPAA